MVDAAAYNAVATSVLAVLSFLLGSWRGRRGEAQPVTSARSTEGCECLFSGCSPAELKEQLEVLQDLSAIAQIQDSLEESEDGETDYMEVMEYLRVAPLLLFTECAKPLPAAAKPSLH